MSKGNGTACTPSLFRDRQRGLRLSRRWATDSDVTIYQGDCRDLLACIPDGTAQLVVTSPPYNLGKSYERRIALEAYIAEQNSIIGECVRILDERGSICWQVGNYVDSGSIIPLDTVLYPVFKKYGLRMRNRIVWHFAHGLHCTRRFSGRYETIIWFTKSDDYVFSLDPVRIPQKYPGKRHFKGPHVGELSGNPKGKNPGDVWNIPNVKNNHVEKTSHPCQFPVELVERLVLSMTSPGGLVVDPFIGVGTTAVAAIRHNRRCAGAELVAEYAKTARDRVALEATGRLRTRPMGKPVYQPNGTEKVAQNLFRYEFPGEAL